MKKKVNNLTKQFPNIFRFIPEGKFFKNIFKSKVVLNSVLIFSLFLSITFILLIIITSFNLYKNTSKLINVINKRQEVGAKINFWKSITDKYDGYKDAYFQIAVLEYQLGNFKKAKYENNNALLLDPNFSEAKKLEELLRKN